MITKIKNAMQSTVDKIKARLKQPAVKKPVTEQIKKQVRPSVLARLEQGRANVERRERERKQQQAGRPKSRKQDMEL